MTATVTGTATFGPMLKEFYQGPVAEQINNRVWMREYFQKKSKGWSGSRMIIPVHTSRNTGVGFAGEAAAAGAGAVLPTAGSQGYANLTVNSRNSYGRFQVTGQAMDTATKGGSGAFAGVMDEEMNRLVRDLANNENYAAVFGGAVKGLLNQRRASPENTGGPQTNVPAEMSDPATWQYQGDFSYFDGTRTGVAVAQATTTTWVKVRLYRMDTYAEILPTIAATGAATTNPNFFVTAFSADRTNPTIDITYGKDDAAVATFTTADVGEDAAIAVVIAESAVAAGNFPVDSAGAQFGQDSRVWNGLANIGGQNLLTNQPTGLFTNLCEPTHFGVDRTSATATGDILQSSILTHDTGNGDRTNAGADLSLERLQYMMDVLQQDAGVDANVMVMNALMRHRYTVQLTGILGTGNSNNIVIDGNSGKVMDNQQNLAYGGVKFQYDRTFPVATIAMLHSDDWILAELTTGQFADEDGNVLFRVQGQDAYEGFWKHRYNICCKRPNAQLILTGITPT
jgi:hypothetical protein